MWRTRGQGRKSRARPHAAGRASPQMALFAVGAVLATLSAAPAAAFMPTALPKCAPPFRGRAAASPTRRYAFGAHTLAHAHSASARAHPRAHAHRLQMTVPKSAEDERALQTAREEAKKALLASCEDFRVAQVRCLRVRQLVFARRAACCALPFPVGARGPPPAASCAPVRTYAGNPDELLQLKLWAAEAEEEARLKAAGVDVKKEKDRLGGLFGAESLGTVRCVWRQRACVKECGHRWCGLGGKGGGGGGGCRGAPAEAKATSSSS